MSVFIFMCFAVACNFGIFALDTVRSCVEKETKEVCKFPTLHGYSLVIQFSLASLSLSLSLSLDLDLDLDSSPYYSLASLSVAIVLRGDQSSITCTGI